MTRDEILGEAARLISQDRHEQHGDAHQNFHHIAAGWSEILGYKVAAHEVGLCMAWLKITRAVSSPDNDDNYKDGVGYMALAGEIAAARREE